MNYLLLGPLKVVMSVCVLREVVGLVNRNNLPSCVFLDDLGLPEASLPSLHHTLGAAPLPPRPPLSVRGSNQQV